MLSRTVEISAARNDAQGVDAMRFSTRLSASGLSAAKVNVFVCCLLAAAAIPAAGQDGMLKLPVATVEGQPVYEEDLLPAIQPQLMSVRQQEYEIKKKALDDLIQQKLLENAAKKKGVTAEQLL